jgi:hypothetical protein
MGGFLLFIKQNRAFGAIKPLLRQVKAVNAA